jgi:hypothetical protein
MHHAPRPGLRQTILVLFGLLSILVLCVPGRASAQELEDDSRLGEIDDDDFQFKSTSFPIRERLAFGLDIGVAVAHTHERASLPVLIGVNLRGGWCIEPWVMVGADWTMDFAVATDGYADASSGDPSLPASLSEPKLLQPMVTFYPALGLTLRAGGGFDPFDLHRFPITGALGWEFPIDQYGGFGLMVTASHLFHTDSRPDWQLYMFSLAFSGYRVGRGWFDSLTKDAPPEFD